MGILTADEDDNEFLLPRAGSEDMGSRFQLLPGWRWITMAAGLYLNLAAAECPAHGWAAARTCPNQCSADEFLWLVDRVAYGWRPAKMCAHVCCICAHASARTGTMLMQGLFRLASRD